GLRFISARLPKGHRARRSRPRRASASSTPGNGRSGPGASSTPTAPTCSGPAAGAEGTVGISGCPLAARAVIGVGPVSGMTSHEPPSPRTSAPTPGSKPLLHRRIVLGVTGSIAAYKAVLLLRLLQDAGAEVEVLLTAAGSR